MPLLLAGGRRIVEQQPGSRHQKPPIGDRSRKDRHQPNPLFASNKTPCRRELGKPAIEECLGFSLAARVFRQDQNWMICWMLNSGPAGVFLAKTGK